MVTSYFAHGPRVFVDTLVLIQSIAATLAGNVALRELDLSWNNLRQESAASIGKALCLNRGLQSLSLAHNAFNDAPSQELGDSLRANGVLKVTIGKQTKTNVHTRSNFLQDPITEMNPKYLFRNLEVGCTTSSVVGND